ncbi:PREDICTED: putative late blight resistance protein homolog R1B-23 [Ipomoea nil]|uniref:putative late blight resistance protein homolog R1B-23 n=2 Tax=Ipomoea nil TaxID=35883 RepID=UPI000900F119|nr:PREDICTED: putative late blight resistance protein homolog R1B-23 [Ipomoea nil]
MACVALASLMATIDLEFRKPNHRVSLHAEKPLNSLFEKLSSLQAFLEKEYNNGGAPARHLAIKIRDFALKAEDDIEIQLRSFLLAQDGKCQAKARGELHQSLRKAAEDAEELSKIINNSRSSEPEAAMTSETHPSIHWLKPENVVLDGPSLPCSPNLEDQFNEDAFNAVKKMLFYTFEPKNIVSIVGLPGIGKTTLAKRVYGSDMAEGYIRAWVTVPQEYKGNTLSQLIKEKLHKHLGGRHMYFLVLDNIPNTRVLGDILTCLPNASYQIRILLTTQFNAVGCDAATFGNVHKMCILDPNRSWDLFCNKLSPKELRAPKFVEIAKHVVKECEGLPRSIVAVAERFSKCDYILKEWMKIEKEVETLGPLYNDAEHLSKLTLSYNQLPQHLKVCFLNFAVYPKGFKINVKRLIRIWIAEGFVRQMECKGFGRQLVKDLEEEGYCYLDGLVHSGLVSISKWEHKMTNVCWIHSSLWDFCTRETKKEGLLCAAYTRKDLGLPLDMFVNSCRWLSLYSHRLDYYALFTTNNPRSLFFFQGDFVKSVSFKLLRIVDLSALQIFEIVPLHLRDLVFLRYLSVPPWFEGLDDVVSNNQNLQTIIVCGGEPQLLKTGHLSFRIWELPHLRHLELGNYYEVDPPNRNIEQLQTLSWVSPTHFTEEVYKKFPNLEYLKVYYKGAFDEPCSSPGPCRNPTINLDYIRYLSKLETLTVIIPENSMTHLEQLVFSTRLKKLRLSGTNLPIMKFPRVLSALKVLKLENAFSDLVWGSFEEFYNLEVLLIEATNLQKWVVKSTNFPKLSCLILRRCYRLEEMLFEVRYIDTLKTIKVEQCSPYVVDVAMKILEERKWLRKKSNDPWEAYNIRKARLNRVDAFYTPLTVVVDDVIHDVR